MLGLLLGLGPARQGPPGDRALPGWPGAALDPDRPLRLLAFGTSLTHDETWPGALAAELAACLDRPVALEIVAQPGAGSAWALTRMAEVAALEPDILLVEFAINDADLFDGVTLADSRRQHAQLLSALRAARPEAVVVLMTMNPVRGALRQLQRPRLGAYYGLYGALAERFDTGLVDLTPRWRADAAAMGDLPDGLHPGPETAARVIVPPLRAALLRAAGAAVCP